MSGKRTATIKELKIAACFVFATQIMELVLFAAYRNYISIEYGYSGLSWPSVKYYAAFYLVYLFSTAFLILFIYLAIKSPIFLRPIYVTLYGVLCLYEFTYQDVYGRFSTIHDLRFASVITASQALESVQIYTNFTGLIPVGALTVLLIVFVPKLRLNIKQSLTAALGFAALLMVFNLAFWSAAPRFYQNEALNNSFGAGTRTAFASLFSAVSFHGSKRQIVTLEVVPSKPLNNIVLVVDESVRGDHLSLNGYPRPTTPFLDSLAKGGKLKNWGISASGSTRSYESFRYLLTGIQTNDPKDIEAKAGNLPTLFQYARAMGYETYYLDGQKDDNWVGEPADMNYLDVFLGKKYFDPQHGNQWEIDGRIATKIRELSESGVGKFIVVFKHGLHVPYDRNFPVSEAIWRPTATTPIHGLQQGTREVLINTYDNAIRFNMKLFFGNLLSGSGEPPQNTVVFYTSDHGQTLNEGGEVYTHGGHSIMEATVPLFIIGNLPTETDTGFLASHENIFATVLDLMRFPESKQKTGYAVSLLKATSADNSPRFYFTPKERPGKEGTMETERLAFD